jgi:hypothetical protein
MKKIHIYVFGILIAIGTFFALIANNKKQIFYVENVGWNNKNCILSGSYLKSNGSFVEYEVQSSCIEIGWASCELNIIYEIFIDERHTKIIGNGRCENF